MRASRTSRGTSSPAAKGKLARQLAAYSATAGAALVCGVNHAEAARTPITTITPVDNQVFYLDSQDTTFDAGPFRLNMRLNNYSSSGFRSGYVQLPGNPGASVWIAGYRSHFNVHHASKLNFGEAVPGQSFPSNGHFDGQFEPTVGSDAHRPRLAGLGQHRRARDAATPGRAAV